MAIGDMKAGAIGGAADIIKDTTTANFVKDVVEASRQVPVLVDFWADWCGPCRSFAPVFEQAAIDNPDLVFAKIDTEAQPELAGAFQIRSIPTLMIFREKVLVFAQPGALPGHALADLIGQVRGLDMDEVHRAVAESSS